MFLCLSKIEAQTPTIAVFVGRFILRLRPPLYRFTFVNPFRTCCKVGACLRSSSAIVSQENLLKTSGEVVFLRTEEVFLEHVCHFSLHLF